jgi:hypothetical protein
LAALVPLAAAFDAPVDVLVPVAVVSLAAVAALAASWEPAALAEAGLGWQPRAAATTVAKAAGATKRQRSGREAGRRSQVCAKTTFAPFSREISLRTAARGRVSLVMTARR